MDRCDGMDCGIQIRRMRREDVTAVAELERESFSSPWTAKDFSEDLERPEYVFLVAEPKERESALESLIVGYVGLRTVLDEAEITTIAVERSRQGKGIGRLLLRQAKEVCREQGARLLHLEVRVSNTPARCLYVSEGFLEDGRRKNYYQHPREDALLMTTALFGDNYH